MAVLCTVAINKTISKEPMLGLVLGGIMITNLCAAFTSYIKLIADSDDKLPAITFWLMGGFHAMTNSKLASIIIPIGVSLIIIFIMRWKLNVFSFGEEGARSMGVNTRRVRFWVGLVIPHLGRAIIGANFNELIAASALLRAIYFTLF